jgi:hypothetical protein
VVKKLARENAAKHELFEELAKQKQKNEQK